MQIHITWIIFVLVESVSAGNHDSYGQLSIITLECPRKNHRATVSLPALHSFTLTTSFNSSVPLIQPFPKLVIYPDIQKRRLVSIELNQTLVFSVFESNMTHARFQSLQRSLLNGLCPSTQTNNLKSRSINHVSITSIQAHQLPHLTSNSSKTLEILMNTYVGDEGANLTPSDWESISNTSPALLKEYHSVHIQQSSEGGGAEVCIRYFHEKGLRQALVSLSQLVAMRLGH